MAGPRPQQRLAALRVCQPCRIEQLSRGAADVAHHAGPRDAGHLSGLDRAPERLEAIVPHDASHNNTVKGSLELLIQECASRC